MQWTSKPAHRLLQIRTADLNEQLEDTFRTWYPDFIEGTKENMVVQCPQILTFP